MASEYSEIRSCEWPNWVIPGSTPRSLTCLHTHFWVTRVTPGVLRDNSSVTSVDGVKVSSQTTVLTPIKSRLVRTNTRFTGLNGLSSMKHSNNKLATRVKKDNKSKKAAALINNETFLVSVKSRYLTANTRFSGLNGLYSMKHSNNKLATRAEKRTN